MTSLDTDILSERIERKHGLLVQLRDLARRQLQLIDANDLTQLLKLLASKQKLLTLLQALERDLDSFRLQDPEARIWRTAQDRDRCAQLAANCEVVRADIIQTEKTSETRLIFRRDEAASRLQGVHQASQIRNAYAQPADYVRSQLDLSSDG